MSEMKKCPWHAYNEGYMACYGGLPMTDNPLPVNELWGEWRLGWLDSREHAIASQQERERMSEQAECYRCGVPVSDVELLCDNCRRESEERKQMSEQNIDEFQKMLIRMVSRGSDNFRGWAGIVMSSAWENSMVDDDLIVEIKEFERSESG